MTLPRSTSARDIGNESTEMPSAVPQSSAFDLRSSVHGPTVCIAMALLAVAAAHMACRCGAVELDSVMLVDPVLEPVIQVSVFSLKLTPLWLEALSRPESDLKREAAEAIAKAHRLGMSPVEDVIDPLIRELRADETHITARLAIARALIALDARQAATSLASRAASDGLEMARVVEPALAAWGHRALCDQWLARLDHPAASRRRLILAIQALGQMREVGATENLRHLATVESFSPDVRLEAAHALSLIGPEELTSAAGRLLSAPHRAQLVNRLVAARLLAGVPNGEAEPLLLELAVDSEPAVAAIALETILRLNPHLVADIQPRLIANHDSRIRRLTASLLLKQCTTEAVELLSKLLADPHPGLRVQACDALVELAARKDLEGSVSKVIMQALESETAEEVEQAILAAGILRIQPAAERLLELLDASQPDVSIAAAWALRKLANPETGPGIVAKVRRETDRRRALVQQLAPIVAANPYAPIEYPPVDDSNAQLEQLIQALGMMRYEAAEPLLRTFVAKPPRPQIGEPPVLETEKQATLRAAAIWFLGVHYGPAAPDLLRQSLRERLADTHPKHPEHPLVRRMAAVSLARMNDRQALEIMRPLCDPPKAYTELGRACRWAVQEITGERFSQLPAIPIVRSDWFLVPLDP